MRLRTVAWDAILVILASWPEQTRRRSLYYWRVEEWSQSSQNILVVISVQGESEHNGPIVLGAELQCLRLKLVSLRHTVRIPPERPVIYIYASIRFVVFLVPPDLMQDTTLKQVSNNCCHIYSATCV